MPVRSLPLALVLPFLLALSLLSLLAPDAGAQPPAADPGATDDTAAARARADEVPAAPTAPARATPPPADRHMRVYLNDGRIGDHWFRFETTDGADRFHVRSEADMRVKFAFVTVYRYEHRAREQWVDGCLRELDATTDDNGTDLVTTATWDAGKLRVDGGDGAMRRHDLACPWTFAYWDRDMLERNRLLNPQDGRLLDVDVRPLGQRALDVGDATMSAQAWKVEAEGMDLVVYYDEDDAWLGLDSTVEEGRVLRYRPDTDDPLHP